MGRALKKDDPESTIIHDLMRPNIPAGSHPIETDDYKLPTNEVLNVYSSVCEWVKYGTTGATIYGRPRLGKTKMIEYLVEKIPLNFSEPIPVYHIVNLHPKIAKEEEFVETLLSDMKHKFAYAGKLSVKRQRLIDFLTLNGTSNKYRSVILFIDEAQCLETQHYNWLIDYYNKLEKEKVKMFVFLVGQEQLNAQKQIYKAEHSDQIVQRFMIEEYKFSGLKSEEDIKTFLECYDTESDFPANSGWSFTRYFFPEAFSTGERLAQFSKQIYEHFVGLRQKNNIKGPFEIPMHHMVKAVKILFLDYGYGSKGYKVWISMGYWQQSIKKSNYIVSEQRKILDK